MSFRQPQLAGRHRMRPVFGLLAITLIGCVIRLIEIDRWPLWSDEALTLLIAQWPLEYLLLVPVDPTPGLYYSLHKLLLGPTAGVAAARSISLVCGTLLIPATYFLAREARIPALLGAVLIALSFPLIDYSQEARAYSLLVLLIVLSATFFVRWTRAREVRDLVATLATSILAFYTHFASVFWIGPAVVAIFWLGRRKAVAPLLLTAILAVPELLRISRYPSDGFVWLAQATPIEAADTLARALLPFRPAGAWLLLAIVVAAWRAWVHRSKLRSWARANPGAAFAIGALAAAPVLIWLFGLVTRPVFMTRTILIGVPGVLLLLSLLLKFEPRILRFVIAALYAASLLATGTTRQKEDWAGVAERVGNDSILMCQPGEVAAMRYAAGGRNRIFLNRIDGAAEMSGEPWQRAYYEIMTDKRRMDEALKLGKAAYPSLEPVWPLLSGKLLANRPGTLARAIMLCVDQPYRRPRYIPD